MSNSNGYHTNSVSKKIHIDQKLEPMNEEAERGTLGSILVDSDQLLFVREILKPDDFYFQGHIEIYRAMLNIDDDNKKINQVVLCDELERTGKIKHILGEHGYITNLGPEIFTGLHAVHYANIVKRCSVNRQLIWASGKIAAMAYKNNLDPDEAIGEANKTLLDISTENVIDKPQPAKVFASLLFDAVERRAANEERPLITGLKSLDRKLSGGLWPRKLYLLAGRPGMAKTSLALQMIMANAKQLKTGLLFSLEMGGEEVMTRLVSSEAKIDGDLIQRGQIGPRMKDFNQALDKVAQLDFYIDDKTRTIEGIKSRCLIQASMGLDLVVVDYIQLIDTARRHDTRTAEVGAISRALKSLAMILDIPVVAVSSLNRACESRNNKRPILADLRESGDLEYDADVVLFNYWDKIYNEDTEFPNLMEIHTAKHRGGSTGSIETYFRPEFTQFNDIEIKTVRLD